jgi:O-succinylbenzoate synthase
VGELMRAFRIPLRVRFRGVTAREGLLLEGSEGWSEFSPFPEYGAAVSARWLAAAREVASTPGPEPVRTKIPVNVTVPALSPEDAHSLVKSSGCSTAKVKVAEGDDEARVEAVRDALGPSGNLRIDANGSWNVETATSTIRSLSRYDLEYVEQPVATLEEMAQLRKLVDVPLAADESVRTAGDPLHLVKLEAADIVVLKVQPLGGVWPALRVAESCGLPAVVSSALETSVGIAAGLALAAALPELPYACGLGTVSLLEGDVTADPLLPVDGAIEPRRPEVDETALARYELTDGMQIERWMRRLDSAQRAHQGS